MRTRRPAVWMLAAAAAACGNAPSVTTGDTSSLRVVVITVDGLVPDAIARAPARHIQGLMAEGAWSNRARTVSQPETLPSHISMVTGLTVERHGVRHNKDVGGTLEPATVYTRVHEAGGPSAIYVGKSKLTLLAGPGLAGTVWGAGQDGMGNEGGEVGKVAARFAADFPTERFRFSWVHLREPDWAGHHHGWMTAGYLDAVRDADRAVGVVLSAIADSGLGGSTAVILTSDHGGEDTGHWSGGSDASFVIPWICRAPGVPAGPIEDRVNAVDLAPTVLALLGLPPLDGIDGRAVSACLPH